MIETSCGWTIWISGCTRASIGSHLNAVLLAEINGVIAVDWADMKCWRNAGVSTTGGTGIVVPTLHEAELYGFFGAPG